LAPRNVEAPGQPLETVAGWSLSVTGTAVEPLTGSSRLLSYARVLFPIAVLACGLALAGWLMRREIALAERQSTFVAAVTHEFKSPLTSIRLLMERLAGGRIGTEESAARYHAAIGAETERLENLVNRLLESQKLQSDQRTYDLQPSSLQTIVRETVDRLRPQAEAKDIQISARVIGAVPDLPLDVQAMFDAVRNLIDNAIKYSPAHTEITVALDIDGPDVRLTVSDQGVGIDPADATRVFEPFFRGRRGERVNVQGTGLGLSLVRATAEAHGGTVAVEDNGGRGSRFILRVPRPHPPVDLPASAPLEPEHL
jgi:signal transduction histidine kinase